jgi:1,4-dihydroxy-2-naphthoate octaprenyltransferase
MAYQAKLGQIKLWLRATRAPFFQAVIIPIVLGTTVAWYKMGIFHPGYFLLALLAGVFINAGTNLANDYFDHKSGSDPVNNRPTTFSGGSRVIQQGLISPRQIFIAALLFFGLAVLIGLILYRLCGWPILIFGTIGLLSGYFYTAPPLKLGYRGCGELLVGLNLGPLVVLGAYYVQAKTISLDAFAASLPLGFLITAVLYINQFPDYFTDKMTKKNTLVVIMGRGKAIKGFYLLVVFVYFVITAGIVMRIAPWPVVVSFLTLPLAWKTIRLAAANYTGTEALKPVMANTIIMHLLVGLLLSLGYLAARIFV